LRILHVSAHYPPNFVSGGTLVPQRLARGQRSRELDARVYAGYLDERLPPLQSWADDDETGLPVRWIVTTPWTGWDDRTNYCNPAVEFDFQEYLREFPADVVHLHSLQSLGAGLVAVAADAGARVLVTMHDFWWVCARQFLVDRDRVPCCLVVDAGVCRCQVDHAYLAERNAYLFSQLRRADVVLAPSRSAAAVLEANGVAGRRLRVDENGLPGEAVEATATARVATGNQPRSASEPVRFLFTGGSDAMKGAQVLVAAATRLAHRSGWTLDAYGFSGPADIPDDVPPSVWFRGQYAPHELDAVMSSHDVLIVPSLMRESYSLVTREALTRGLAVICTDTLGPEEAVSHGVNGFVVPAGDADGLADAMMALVEDSPLLARFRGEGPAQPIRTLSEQLDGLEQLYRDLVRGKLSGSNPSLPTAEDAIQTVLFVVGIEGAPLRYRARLPAEALELHGIKTEIRSYRDPSVVPLAQMADAVVFYRVPATDQVIELIDDIRRRPEPVPLLFDVDDLIFDPSLRDEIPAMKLLHGAEADLWMHGVRRYRTTMEACDFFIGSTEELCRHSTFVTGIPSARFANGVGILLSELSDVAIRRPRRPGPLRIGYFSGTITHDHDWLEIEEAVIEVMNRHPVSELVLGGHLNTSSRMQAVASRTRRLPILPWYQLPGVLRDLDVNLAPLEPIGRFNEAKSAIKWLEAALVGTPTIASPTQPFREVIVPGVNGLLASTPDEWLTSLDMLLTDAVTRRRTGSRARRDALLRYSPHRQAEVYLSVLAQARAVRVERGPRVPSPDWVPTVTSEPFTPTTLEPYTVSGAASPVSGPTIGGRAKHLARVTAQVYEQDGLAEVARRAARSGHRTMRAAAMRVRDRLEAVGRRDLRG
jgi:glycosyltransferase involved in cell wall biosynthesis